VNEFDFYMHYKQFYRAVRTVLNFMQTDISTGYYVKTAPDYKSALSLEGQTHL